MNLEIRDPALLSSLQPANMEGYLLTAGWKQTFADPRVFSIWSKAGTPDDSEVRVPLDPDASGYPQRVKELLDEIAATENRSQLRVFQDLSEWNCDTIRFSWNPVPEQSRSSLSDTIDALQSVREILSSVARSVVETEGVRPGHMSDYMDSVEVSAFEEPASIRVLARLGTVRFEDQQDFVPFARRVSLGIRETFGRIDNLLHSGVAVVAATEITRAGTSEVPILLWRLLYRAGWGLDISVRLASCHPPNDVALSTWRFHRADLETLKGIAHRLERRRSADDLLAEADPIAFLADRARRAGLQLLLVHETHRRPLNADEVSQEGTIGTGAVEGPTESHRDPL